MLPTAMSNSTSMSEEASVSSGTRAHDYTSLNPLFTSISSHNQPQPKAKKKRNQPGNPDPDSEVIALSPKTLMATNRFICEICNKGFQRDQNLQLHRRGHNLPWKLRQRNNKEIIKKRVYVCPEPSCVHHSPSRALGDLTGIKKHFCRKHGEKKWKCDKCSKKYAVMSDWKAHSKTCGTREYRCDCGTLFSRKDSFITHRAFCDALAEESARLTATATAPLHPNHHFFPFSWDPLLNPNPNPNPNPTSTLLDVKPVDPHPFPLFHNHLTTTTTSPYMSATALLQRASSMGPLSTTTTTAAAATTTTNGYDGVVGHTGLDVGGLSTWQQKGGDCLTRDFLGVAGETAEELLSFTGLGLEFVSESCDQDPTTTTATTAATTTRPHPGFGFPTNATSQTWGDC